MRHRLLLTAVVLCLSPGAARAALNCSVSATPLAFGTVAFSAINSSGMVMVHCNGAASYTIALSAGGSGSFSPRQMSSGSMKLQYNIYKDSARTQVWGDGTAGTVTNAGSFGSGGGSTNFTTFGTVPVQTAPAPGSYTDTITVTVSY